MKVPTLFTLRWESTGNRWWFASPIDYAAANGYYDLVKELIHLDPNLLIKLTSLPRTRRLESVWDDEDNFHYVAKCRSKVAYQLLHESETNKGYKSLIRSGCGGWLLYTAAAAGDLIFVNELLDRNPALVFGEGEYGVTDMFYAAARSKNCDVFKILFEYSVSPMGRLIEEPSVFLSELVNRGVHAAARGGGLEILIKLLDEYGDPTSFRDAYGSTPLHSAAGKGEVQIVKYLISRYNILNCLDNEGNTALHVAAYFGHYSVIEILLSASGSLSSVTNKNGDTYLHLVFSAFGSPNFRRVDLQIGLTKKVMNTHNLENIINVQNKDGRTALDIAAINNIPASILDLIMSTRYIRYNNGKAPLDRPISSESLMRRMISFGGISYTWNNNTRNSPGTRFSITDAEMFLFTEESGSESMGSTPPRKKIMNDISSQLKNLLLKPQRRGYISDCDETNSWESYGSYKGNCVSLRRQFSTLPMNKRKRVQG